MTYADDIVVVGKEVPDYGYNVFNREYFFDIFGERGRSDSIFGNANFFGTDRPYTDREKRGDLAPKEKGFFASLWEDVKRWANSIWEGLKSAKWGFGATGTEWMLTAGGLTYTHRKKDKPTNPSSVPGFSFDFTTIAIVGFAGLLIFFLVR